MHPVSHAVWWLVGSLACLGSIANAAAGVLEFDVVFPRSNETYAPTDKFPIVFAVQNAELAEHFKLSINLLVRNGSNLESAFGHGIHDLSNTIYSTEPYFIYRYVNIDTEGPHELFCFLTWQSCDESGDQVRGNTTNFSTYFTINKGGQEADLVAATANDKTCSTKDGLALNVTDKTHEVPVSGKQPAGTCPVLDSTSPTTTANPCAVKIDTAAAASITAALHAASCKGSDPPADCPEENAAQQLVVVGALSFAAVFGTTAFLLA